MVSYKRHKNKNYSQISENYAQTYINYFFAFFLKSDDILIFYIFFKISEKLKLTDNMSCNDFFLTDCNIFF